MSLLTRDSLNAKTKEVVDGIVAKQTALNLKHLDLWLNEIHSTLREKIEENVARGHYTTLIGAYDPLIIHTPPHIKDMEDYMKGLLEKAGGLDTLYQTLRARHHLDPSVSLNLQTVVTGRDGFYSFQCEWR